MCCSGFLAACLQLIPLNKMGFGLKSESPTARAQEPTWWGKLEKKSPTARAQEPIRWGRCLLIHRRASESPTAEHPNPPPPSIRIPYRCAPTPTTTARLAHSAQYHCIKKLPIKWGAPRILRPAAIMKKFLPNDKVYLIDKFSIPMKYEQNMNKI